MSPDRSQNVPRAPKQEELRSNTPLAPGRSGGAIPPTRVEVGLAAQAARAFATDRDIPDPLGFEDLAHDRAETAAVIARRSAEGRMPLRVDCFPLPKKGGMRIISCLDPYDDLALRVVIGRLVPGLRSLLDGTDVFSYPVEGVGQRWQYGDHRRASRRRRDRGLALLNDPRTTGLGTFDVVDYYRSVDIDRLAAQLGSCPPGAVDAMRVFLAALPAHGGVPGLPIGFEGSGVLGNLYLLPADDVLAQRRVGLVRWTDDTWIFLAGDGDWWSALDEYKERLGALGLELNASKADYHDKMLGFPEDVISNGAIDSVIAASVGHVDSDTARDLLEAELAGADINSSVVNFALGCLRREMLEWVPSLVEEHPELWEIAPKVTGDVLIGAANHPVTRRRVDHDWLAELASTDEGDARMLAGRLHACRVAGRLPLGRSTGRIFFDLATSPAAQDVPLRAHAAMAWASSEQWKAGPAGEAALEAGPLTLRRSFVGGFKHRLDQRRAHPQWQKLSGRLRKEEPDIAPTLAWASA